MHEYPFGPKVRIISRTHKIVVQVFFQDHANGSWQDIEEYSESDPMALHWATLRALDARRSLLEGESPLSSPDTDLFLHALNYRTAASEHAELAWNELKLCVSRLIKRGYL
ncbi:MAG: hypothetical protein E6R04_09750 [Spirochaetes bacterium]|nr:MAG: hypothetical protein E6R04_09750 [Spirochaetota bacterium]